MKKTFSPLLVSFVLSLLSLCSPQSVAQDLDSGAVEGYVRDQFGATLPGASVRITRVRDGATRTTTTDGRGHYRFIQLEPASYMFTANLTGFDDAQSEVLIVTAGQNIKFDISLAVSGVDAGTVIVSAHKDDAVDTSRTVVGTSIDSKELSDLPLASRSPLDIVFTLPGVAEEALSTRDLAEDRNRNASSTPEESGTMSLAGGTAYSNNFTIDGLDNNDDRAARERFQPPIDAIEEVQVITNQFSAEYGRASGGRVNLRTRSASNRLAGRVFYYFRDESLDANSFNNNADGLKRLPLQQHTPGFTIGGPTPNVGSHHLPSFFFAFEQHRVLDTSFIDTLVPVEQNTAFPLPPPTHPQASRLEIVDEPSLAATIAPLVVSVPTPFIDTSLTSRLDQQFSTLHNGSFVLQVGRQSNLRQFSGGNRLAESLQAKVRNSAALSYNDTYVLSETSVNQLRLQFSELQPSLEAVLRNKPVVLIALNDPLPAENLTRRSGTLVAGSSSSSATERREDRFQVQNILSMVRKTHSLKFGLDVHYVRSDFVDLSDGTRTFNFSSAGDFLASVPSRYRQ